mmetsp:Transcript_101933/g.287680  ORF Transcript_101933/g.287680 Transcript_101933/m.287680 type:complete len:361 (-) Transcript_101933:93-1175(-)
MDGAALLALGRKALEIGDDAGARRHLLESIAVGPATVDAHLLMAEAIWRGSEGDREQALPHYEAATVLARQAGDASQEAMINIGHGFALLQLGMIDRGCELLRVVKERAEAAGNARAAQFAQHMLDQAGLPAPPSEAERIRQMWCQFTRAKSEGKKLMLFLRGTPSAPACPASLDGVARLRAAGASHVSFFDVTQKTGEVPEGLQGLSDSAHLHFPQLFVDGAELEGWRELEAAKLRERLLASDVELGEMAEASQPCHGGAALSDGLEPWEVALVELVAKSGVGAWGVKAATLVGQFPDVAPLDAAALDAAWQRLAPSLKEKLEHQPEMPCGHSCNTCPTKHDCNLHDAVGHVRDIEDLG